jgi:hypothetical protein
MIGSRPESTGREEFRRNIPDSFLFCDFWSGRGSEADVDSYFTQLQCMVRSSNLILVSYASTLL